MLLLRGDIVQQWLIPTSLTVYHRNIVDGYCCSSYRLLVGWWCCQKVAS